MTSKIVKCTCKHEFQDKMYGMGNRLGNEMRSGQIKCTVCSTVLGAQNVTQAAKPAKEAAPEQSKKKAQADTKADEKAEKKRSLKGGKR